jgi:hypothetical protein
MTSRKVVLPLGFGLSAILALPAGASEEAPPSRRAPRVYTNEDLDRVHRFRDQTGVQSVPAEAAETAPARPAEGKASRERGEEYWRREASRVRDKVQALEVQAAGLRVQIAERAAEERHSLTRRRPRGGGAGSEATLRAKLAALEQRMRRLEDELLDRARRAGALPGWLR